MKKYNLMEVNENISALLGTKYDNLFEPIIKSKGTKYSRLNKISDVYIAGNRVSAKVLGTKKYDVIIKFNKEKI